MASGIMDLPIGGAAATWAGFQTNVAPFPRATIAPCGCGWPAFKTANVDLLAVDSVLPPWSSVFSATRLNSRTIALSTKTDIGQGMGGWQKGLSVFGIRSKLGEIELDVS